MRRILLISIAFPLAVFAQKPVISSVVNAASYQAVDATAPAPFRMGLDGSSIGTIFGSNLASSTASATSTPLPTHLGGASVTYDGILLPLLYVSSTQINFETPTDQENSAVPHGVKNLVVTTAAGGASAPFLMSPVDGTAIGIFTRDSSGCGEGAVLNDKADGTVSINSPSNSASPGDYISIFGTGLYIPYPPPDGAPAPANPPAVANDGGGALFDLSVVPPANSLAWAGLAPGLVGVDQVNAQVPLDVREGCAVPLQIFGTLPSQPVTISIRMGGGPCADPPSAGYGQILWQKTVVTPPTGPSAESDILTVSLQASPGKKAPPGRTYTDTGSVYTEDTVYGPSCSIPGYRSLDAGGVTAQGAALGPLPASIVPLQQGQVSGLSIYQVTLPAGAIQAGQFSVTALGGTDVGAFQSDLTIPSGIQVTTPIAGVDFDAFQPITINWTGGDPNAWVTFRLVRHSAGLDDASVVQARASDGSVTLPNTEDLSTNGNQLFALPGPYTSDMEIDLEVTPDPSEIITFSAPGLSLGGQHTWSYLYRFLGVTIGGS